MAKSSVRQWLAKLRLLKLRRCLWGLLRVRAMGFPGCCARSMRC